MRMDTGHPVTASRRTPREFVSRSETPHFRRLKTIDGFALRRLGIHYESHHADPHRPDRPEPHRKRAGEANGRGTHEHAATEPADQEKNRVTLRIPLCGEHCEHDNCPDGQRCPRKQWSFRFVKEPNDDAARDTSEHKRCDRSADRWCIDHDRDLPSWPEPSGSCRRVSNCRLGDRDN